MMTMDNMIKKRKRHSEPYLPTTRWGSIPRPARPRALERRPDELHHVLQPERLVDALTREGELQDLTARERRLRSERDGAVVGDAYLWTLGVGRGTTVNGRGRGGRGRAVGTECRDMIGSDTRSYGQTVSCATSGARDAMRDRASRHGARAHLSRPREPDLRRRLHRRVDVPHGVFPASPPSSETPGRRRRRRRRRRRTSPTRSRPR